MLKLFPVAAQHATMHTPQDKRTSITRRESPYGNTAHVRETLHQHKKSIAH